MNLDQFNLFLNLPLKSLVLKSSELLDQTPRTLMLGRYQKSTQQHTYLGTDGHIHVVLYDVASETDSTKGHDVSNVFHASTEFDGISNNHTFVPKALAFSEHCDFEFCVLLKHYGIHVPLSDYPAIPRDFFPPAQPGFTGYTINGTATASLQDFADSVCASCEGSGKVTDTQNLVWPCPQHCENTVPA